MKGTTCLELMEFESAQLAYEKTLEFEPKNVKAITGLGVIMRYKKKYQEAEDYYYKALKIDPEYYLAKSSLMMLETYKGNIDVAIALGEDSIKKGIDGIEPGVLGNLIIAYHLAGMNELRDKYFNILRGREYADLYYISLLINGTISIHDIFALDLTKQKK